MGKRTKLKKRIRKQLLELGIDEVRHYYQEPTFKREPDYNIAQYGNLLIYYYDVREFFKKCDYKVKYYDDTKLWMMYRYAVGEVTRELMKEGK